VATAWRYVRKAVDLLSTAADDLATAMARIRRLTFAAGRLIWASAALPGRTYDLSAARQFGIIDALTCADMTFADKGYQGAGGTIRVPFKRHRFRPKLQRWQKRYNHQHARIRARGERAIATLKTWKLPG